MNNLLNNNTKISIIANSDIRYEGTLHIISTQEQTISLKNVVSHGTENRKNGVNEIPPQSEIYGYIIFKSSDIKNLNVHDQPSTQQTTLQAVQPQQIIPPQQQQQQSIMNHPPPALDLKEQQTKKINSNQDQNQNFYQGLQVEQNLQNKDQVNKDNLKNIEEKDFDFENTKKLERNIEHQNEEEEKTIIEPKYNKNKGFFDDISTSVNKKERETKEERQHQNQIDKDTFGAEYIQQNQISQSYMHNNRRGQRGGGGYYNNNNQRGGGYRQVFIFICQNLFRQYNNYNNNNNNNNYNNNNQEGYRRQNYDNRNYQQQNRQYQRGYDTEQNWNQQHYQDNNYQRGDQGYRRKEGDDTGFRQQRGQYRPQNKQNVYYEKKQQEQNN